MLEFVNCTKSTNDGLVSYDEDYVLVNFEELMQSTDMITLNFKNDSGYIGISLSEVVRRIGQDRIQELLGKQVVPVPAHLESKFSVAPEFPGLVNIHLVGYTQRLNTVSKYITSRQFGTLASLTLGEAVRQDGSDDRLYYRKTSDLPITNDELMGTKTSKRFMSVWEANPLGWYTQTSDGGHGIRTRWTEGLSVEWDVMRPLPLPGMSWYRTDDRYTHEWACAIGESTHRPGVGGQMRVFWPHYSPTTVKYSYTDVGGSAHTAIITKPTGTTLRFLFRIYDDGSVDIDGVKVFTPDTPVKFSSLSDLNLRGQIGINRKKYWIMNSFSTTYDAAREFTVFKVTFRDESGTIIRNYKPYWAGTPRDPEAPRYNGRVDSNGLLIYNGWYDEMTHHYSSQTYTLPNLMISRY